MSSVADLLAARTRRHGADPLVTYYDLATGARTELSGHSFRNWVDKTANLLVDDLDLAPGSAVWLPLAAAAPGHWQTFVWEAACWQVGVEVDLTGRGSEHVVVCGHDWRPYASARDTVVACALHPLGLGFAASLPGGVLDYALEVRAQPDAYVGGPPAADLAAWRDGERTLAQADLAAVPPAPGRRLLRPADPWAAVRDGLLAPLLGGGSTVVAVGDDADALGRVVATERVTA